MPLNRTSLGALFLLPLWALPTVGVAQDAALRPSTAFVQLGVAEDASALVAGATWNWAWQKPHRWGLFTGYWEASFGRWASRTDASSSHAWVTQLGVTPVVRLHPGGTAGGWYVEGGIGAHVLLPVYRSADKQFSTKFNFGDHLAVGHVFGEGRAHDVALRIQHFSNGGIKEPNPGEDFLQFRYSCRF